MTIKPTVDYFIVEGKIVNRGDEGFDELEAKYVKDIDIEMSKSKELSSGKEEK